jgi:hypothetical protein
MSRWFRRAGDILTLLVPCPVAKADRTAEASGVIARCFCCSSFKRAL